MVRFFSAYFKVKDALHGSTKVKFSCEEKEALPLSIHVHQPSGRPVRSSECRTAGPIKKWPQSELSDYSQRVWSVDTSVEMIERDI